MIKLEIDCDDYKITCSSELGHFQEFGFIAIGKGSSKSEAVAKCIDSLSSALTSISNAKKEIENL